MREKTPNEHVDAGTWNWEQFEKSAKAISDQGVYGANFFRDWNTWISLLSHTWGMAEIYSMRIKRNLHGTLHKVLRR
ncbi:hypothetical protein ACI2OX_12625 [Bacillus sp. N9]